MNLFLSSRLRALGHYAFSVYLWAVAAFGFLVVFSLPLELGRVPPSLYPWKFREILYNLSPYLPTVGLLAGSGLHKYFHREESPFWWNLGLPWPLRLLASAVPLALTAWGLSWIVAWPF